MAANKKSMGEVINHLSRLMTHTLGTEIAAHGVTPGQFPVLMCLWKQDGLTQRELYQRVHIEQATMSNTLGRMERDGLIRRKPDPEDRRASRVLLTAKGRKLEAKIADATNAVDATAQGKLKKKDTKAMMSLMAEMIENLTPPD